MEVIHYSIAAFSLGMIVIGASLGISRIGEKALEATARQPEASNNIRLAMVISAALIEGLAFFAAIICLLMILLK